MRPLFVGQVSELTCEREAYRAGYARLWGDVDVILCPVGPGIALALDGARYWGYTAQWNLLGYPAVVFPVDRVDVGVDGVEEYVPRNREDTVNYGSCESVFSFFLFFLEVERETELRRGGEGVGGV